MPKYDAFGRPLTGDVTFTVGPPTVIRSPRRVLSPVLVVLVLAVLAAIKLGAALFHAPEAAAPQPQPAAARFDLSRTLLAPGRFSAAFAAGLRRAQRDGHGRLEGVVVGYDSLDLQFGPSGGRARGVLVHPDGSVYSRADPQKTDYGHAFSPAQVNADGPRRLVVAGAKLVHVSPSALLSVTLLEDDSSLQWLATFRGFRGDVRADADGSYPEVHPY